MELFKKQIPAFGIFASDFSSRSAAAMASSSIDFVILDMEHSPFSATRLEEHLLGMVDKRRILEKGNLQPDVVPLVRLPANARERLQFMIKQVLDLGVFGVVIPHVESREDALAAVRAMRYPQRQGATDAEPRGQRGVGYGWAARYWGIPSARYPDRADLWPLDSTGELLLWCMIESRQGVENSLEIASTLGVGGIFVGPSDLAFSLGLPFDHPEVEEAIQKILAACKETGIACGTLTSANHVARRLEEGFSFLAVGSDSGLPASVERAIEIGRRHTRQRN